MKPSKIILAGPAKAGKTALMSRYIDGTFNEAYTETAGVDFKIKTIGSETKVQFWDVNTRHRPELAKIYYKAANAIIVCCDLTNREAFNEIDKSIEKIREFSPENAPIFLVGTHSDETNKLQITESELANKAKELNCKGHAVVSSKADENVKQLFDMIVKDIQAKEISRENLHKAYCRHIQGPSVFSKARSDLFGFFNGNGRTVDEIKEDLKKRAENHDGASRETCKELGIEYNQPSNGPK